MKNILLSLTALIALGEMNIHAMEGREGKDLDSMVTTLWNKNSGCCMHFTPPNGGLANVPSDMFTVRNLRGKVIIDYCTPLSSVSKLQNVRWSVSGPCRINLHPGCEGVLPLFELVSVHPAENPTVNLELLVPKPIVVPTIQARDEITYMYPKSMSVNIAWTAQYIMYQRAGGAKTEQTFRAMKEDKFELNAKYPWLTLQAKKIMIYSSEK